MQQELFAVLGVTRIPEALCGVGPKAQEIYGRYRHGRAGVDVRELAVLRRVSRLSYSLRCAEALAVKAHLRRVISLAPGMQTVYVVKDACTWKVEMGRKAAGFGAESKGSYWRRRRKN